MRKVLLLIALVVLFTGALANADQIITENININKNTDNVEFICGHNLYLKQGDKTELKVVMDKSLKGLVKIVTEGDTLKLGDNKERGFWASLFNLSNGIDISGKKLDYYLTLPNISKLSVYGEGNTEVGTFNLKNDLSLYAFGAGRIHMDQIKLERLKINTLGSGSINIKEIDSEVCNLATKGSGGILLEKLNADTLSIDSMGSGEVEVESGKVNSNKIDIMGSSNVNIKKLVSKVCDVNITGSGDAEINATEKVSIQLFGSSDLTVYGNPKHKDISTFGSAHLSFKQ